MKDGRSARKVDIKAEGLLLAWTLVFCAALLTAFALEQKSGGMVQTAPVSVQAAEEKATELNTATAEELAELPGIGETLAQRIIDYRNEHGFFRTPEELMEVSGIGEKRFEALKGKITANGKGTQ